IISEVSIRTHAPDYGGLFERVPVLERIVDGMHTTTAPEVVRNFVLLEKGKPCSPLQRYETERILRTQPFLAQASVTAFADGPDAVRVEVVTVDEPSVVAVVGVEKTPPLVYRLTVGNANMGGQGVYASASWRDGGQLRSLLGGRYSNYQLWGKPYQMHVNGARRERGSEWSSLVSYPFLTDVQRSAWRLAMSRTLDFVPFRRPDSLSLGMKVDRTLADVGAMTRIGRPGRLALLGLSLTMDRARTADMPVTLGVDGELPDSTAALIGRFDSYRVARVNALLGVRAVRFMRVSGFDALSAEQDVRRGVQLGVAFGRSLPIENWDDDVYIAGGAYIGGGGPRSFAAVEVGAEGRRALGADEWNGIYTGGRGAAYFRPHNRHTITTSVEWSGALNPRLPVQLTLADRKAGVRGHSKAREGGAQRLILRLEERWRLGDIRGTGDLGVTAFADAGKLWLADAALGTDTPWRPTVGAGIVLAIPPRSQRLWRVEFAVPLSNGGGGRFEVRLSSAAQTRSWWLEPFDLRRSGRRSPLGVTEF
ncbi:MAG: hypothetical protein AB1762_15940, partial [Gemmatimonadota bacterium]